MSTVFSIGYADHTPESLVAALVSAGVELVADVRANPVSRKKGFSKRQIEATLGAAGIAYLTVRGLGIPTSDRAAAGGAGGWMKLLDDYTASLDQAAAGDESPGRGEEAAALAGEAMLRPVAVMCLESDLGHCHRKPLSEWIARKNGQELAHLV